MPCGMTQTVGANSEKFVHVMERWSRGAVQIPNFLRMQHEVGNHPWIPNLNLICFLLLIQIHICSRENRKLLYSGDKNSGCIYRFFTQPQSKPFFKSICQTSFEWTN